MTPSSFKTRILRLEKLLVDEREGEELDYAEIAAEAFPALKMAPDQLDAVGRKIPGVMLHAASLHWGDWKAGDEAPHPAATEGILDALDAIARKIAGGMAPIAAIDQWTAEAGPAPGEDGLA